MASKTFVYAALLVTFISISYAISDCELPKEEGQCDGKYHSYYFDIDAGFCKPFVWSGCGGNGNRFYSLDECRFSCYSYMKLE